MNLKRPPHPNRAFILITGASRGIGCALAEEFARRGRNLLLVSLPGEDLPTLCRRLSDVYAVRVLMHETDLTQPQSAEQLYGWCLEEGVSVDTLINNAGIGQQGKFEALSVERKRRLMQLNMQAPVVLVHLFLPMLQRHAVSYILNVGSVASFSPIPYKTIYSASKGFILSLSRALRYELRHTPVRVSCLCPGPTLTSPEIRHHAMSVGWRGRVLAQSAENVARYAVAGMLAGQEIIVPGWKHKLAEAFARYLPGDWIIPASGRLFARSLELAATQPSYREETI